MGESSAPVRPGLALATLGAALPYVVYVFDLGDRSASFLNRDFARELGYDADEMERLGPGAFDLLLHEEDRARIPALFGRWASVADGEFLETEYRLRDARGAFRWFLGRDTVLERDGEGNVRKILGTALDITERKSLEVRLQLSQKLEALGRLAGGIAHDFNNIITAVLGNAELAQGNLDDREWVDECLDQIRSAAEQASSLTRSLLGFARQQAIRPEIVGVNALVGELERLLRRLLGEAIDVELELGDDVGSVHIDRSQLTQIVLNLAVNARDAMPEGGALRLATDVRRIDGSIVGGWELEDELEPGLYVAIEVEDSGVGIDPATQRRIFEPFFTTKTEQRGSGLGLATVYGIVHQHRGTIVVRSAPGRGSCFTVYLPRLVNTPETRESPAPRAPSPRGEASVLVVEDALPVAAVLREALVRAGYRVEVAADGDAAVARILRSPALDLVIVDRILPGRSGIEVVRQARLRWPEARVLVISGHPRDLDDEALAALGADFLAKPFAPDVLLGRVHEILADDDPSSRR